jgi:hypothetical protein
MAKISEQNARSQAVTLPASVFCFEIEAIVTSGGFDPFCPERRWQAPEIYSYSERLPPSPKQNGFKPRMYF